MLLGAAIAVHRWWWIAAALVISYALAWLSHFLIEHNRPATFDHPLWSWWADQRMVFLTLIGRMGRRGSEVCCRGSLRLIRVANESQATPNNNGKETT